MYNGREDGTQETWTRNAGQTKSLSHIGQAPLSGFGALTPQFPGEGKDEPSPLEARPLLPALGLRYQEHILPLPSSSKNSFPLYIL